ncbi:unnamed protein product [Clavelina lepadiformis]|uniref:Rho GTPase-activating protein 7 n=1 Tax=Clavelina lepadiformis TaxID=159417 RepID=A0ABP0H1C7_CLALP
MPLQASAYPQGFLMNRRSCEGTMRKDTLSKAIFDMNHRSIQSDPGICFRLQRPDSSTLISDRIMRKLEEARADLNSRQVVMRRRNTSHSLYTAAGFSDSFSGRAGISKPGFPFYPTEQCLYELDSQECKQQRNSNNRRVYVLDSQLLDHSYSSGRVKSTSLSSSATSLYSEDADQIMRSSMNASPIPSFASECPSSMRFGSYPSLCSLIDEDENCSSKIDSSFEETSYLNNNNNSNGEDQGIIKIDGNILVVNLRNFRQEDDDELSSKSHVLVASSDLPTSAEETKSSGSCTWLNQLKDNLNTDDDAEDEDIEQCAISEFWRFEEEARRWSRMDSKASATDSPTPRLSSSDHSRLPQHYMDEIREDDNSDVFTTNRLTSTEAVDPVKMIPNIPQKQWINPDSDISDRSATPKGFKVKPNSFLKRVGGDLKKLGSFRRKELLQRANSTDAAIETEPVKAPKNRSNAESRSKSWRKNKKIVIGEPMLQSGHEKVDMMKCVPIDVTSQGIKELQNQHRGRKGSSQSLFSSSSSSGGASTASTPACRTTTFPEDISSDTSELQSRTHMTLELNPVTRLSQQERDAMFVIPRGYKPGTFPSAIREKGDADEIPFSAPSSASSTRSHSASDSFQPLVNDTRKNSRPMSIYDNLPETALQGDASAQDLINIMDPGILGGVDDSGVYDGSQESLDINFSIPDTACWSVDDIVEHTQSLQEKVRGWEEESPDEEKADNLDTSSVDTFDRHIPTTVEVLPSYSSENVSNIDDENDAANLTNGESRTQHPPRWQSFTRDHAPSTSSQSLQLHTLSVGQLMILRRLSVLKLTALMESYAFSNNNKGSFSWSVPRFIRRNKVPDYKDKNVFGVPLLRNVQKLGQPLPYCIQHALACLRRTALDQVGLFRKPGVRSRIQKLRARCEENAHLSDFDDCSAYDVADMVKQYFRELPDPLMTMKLSETFVGIFLYVPEELRLQTLQVAVMLLPDETRETLKTLLCFLMDVAANSDENHMNESNLSTCFAPSLFYQQYHNARMIASASPKVRKSQAGKNQTLSLGKPDIREMNENKAANQCLAFMIRHVKDLFKTSEDAMTQCRISVMEQTEDVLASEIGNLSDERDYYEDFHAFVDRTVTQTLREEQRISQSKGGWQNVATSAGSELMCKKVNDGNPLRLWRSQVEINGATPSQIMERILHERHLWDKDLLQWKVLQQPDERTQLFQTVRSEMSPQPSRDYCVLRSWRTDINPRGAAAIVETSTGPQPLVGDIRGVILTSRYIIEPTDVPNRCTLTHVTRVDTKGRNPEWYNKAYGHVVTQQLLRISDSIRVVPPQISSLAG